MPIGAGRLDARATTPTAWPRPSVCVGWFAAYPATVPRMGHDATNVADEGSSPSGGTCAHPVTERDLHCSGWAGLGLQNPSARFDPSAVCDLTQRPRARTRGSYPRRRGFDSLRCDSRGATVCATSPAGSPARADVGWLSLDKPSRPDLPFNWLAPQGELRGCSSMVERLRLTPFARLGGPQRDGYWLLTNPMPVRVRPPARSSRRRSRASAPRV